MKKYQRVFLGIFLALSSLLLAHSLFAEEKNPAQASYELALDRYNHLKHLEETQSWDEYFAQGNDYRDQIVTGVQKAIEATKATDALNIQARLLSWQFHKDQQDAFAEQALIDLMSAVSEYANTTGNVTLIKEVADKLSSYQEKRNSRELYKIYVAKIINVSAKDEELLKIAENFYKEGNLELSETVYDAYLERLSKAAPEKLIPLLTGIAKQFAYKDEGNKDTLYAEKIFQKIEDLGKKEAFDEHLMYSRAFNLEKAKEYSKAKDIYLKLIQDFPSTLHADEAAYKAGLISAYVLRDKEGARGYFEKLTSREKDISPQVISSFYQLGLIAQWEENLDKAKEYYTQLITLAAGNFPETTAAANQRLKEIEEKKALDYNTKLFIDLALSAENIGSNMSKSELKASLYNLQKGQEAKISSEAYLPASGCMQIELQYLWSGDTGKNLPSVMAPSFNASYNEPGTKLIGLIVSSSSGTVDRNLDILDVR